MDHPVISRVCTLCGHEKTLDHFGKKQRGKYGRSSQCKICVTTQSLIYQNSPRGIETRKRYFQDRANLDKKLARLNEWRRKNPDKVNKSRIAYQRSVLGKLVTARSRTMIKIKQAKTIESRRKWENKLTLIDMDINRIRTQKEQERDSA